MNKNDLTIIHFSGNGTTLKSSLELIDECIDERILIDHDFVKGTNRDHPDASVYVNINAGCEMRLYKERDDHYLYARVSSDRYDDYDISVSIVISEDDWNLLNGIQAKQTARRPWRTYKF